MRNLIFLFVRYGGFISFCILELLCLYLVVRYNGKQNKIFLNSSSVISGFLYEQTDQLAKFWNLSEVNDSLAASNARLRAELRDVQFRETILEDSVSKEIYSQRYKFIAAEIVNNSVTRHNNHLTINRGSNHGISERMGVFDDEGIVGVVRQAGPRFSTVMSVLHRESRVTAAVKRNNYFGPIVWRGNNPRYVTLSDVPKHADLVKGDTIQTSGYSTIFPAGLMIGTIDTFWLEPGSNFYTIEVLLSNDLSQAKYVYVVNDLMKGELEKLEEEVGDE